MQSFLKAQFQVFCVVLIAFSLPVLAQRGRTPVNTSNTGNSPVFGCANGYGPDCQPANQTPFSNCAGSASCPTAMSGPMPGSLIRDDPTCFLPPVKGIQSSTVSVNRLEVPGKARQEYEKACDDVHQKKYNQAEQHLQKAIDVDSVYTAAWVLLGQVQERQHKLNDAAGSCSRATNIDSNYAPAYLCLAFLRASEGQWNQVQEVTTHLLQLHPVNASNAYYYNALACLHLNDLSSAESSALRGVKDTEQSHQPELHRVLAIIYEKKGDRRLEVAELQEYLKLSPHGEGAAEASSTLKAIAATDPNKPISAQ